MPDIKLKYKIRQSTFDILGQYQCSFSSSLNGGARINSDGIENEITSFAKIEPPPVTEEDTVVSSQDEVVGEPPLLKQLHDASRHQSANDYIQKLNEQEYRPQQRGRLTKKEYLIEKNKHYPDFLLPERRMDAKMRRQGDPDFDPNTLYISPEEMAGLSCGMRRYWDIKKNHMNEIVLYRFGDWYIAYYDDLDVCLHYFDMIVIPHPGSYQLGFAQRDLYENINKLLESGHKVTQVEQTETREQMEKRQADLKRGKKRAEDDQDLREEQEEVDRELDSEWKACRREVLGIYTKGTFNPGMVEPKQTPPKRGKHKKTLEDEQNDQNFDNRYVLVFVRNEQNTMIGFTFFDITILKFYTGSLKSRRQNLFSKFKTLLMQVRPLECVALHQESSKETVKIIRNLSFSPMVQYMTQSNLPTYADTEQMITKYFTNDLTKWPEGLNDLVVGLRKNCDEIAMVSFGLTVRYLESLLLAEQIVPFGQFHPFEGESVHAYINGQNHMTLNGNALENLEIFLVNAQSYDPHSVVRREKGSLMDFVDKTCTPYGQRLLRKWVSMPLVDADKINERLDCVDDLVARPDLVTRYRVKARKTSHDLERMLSKVYSYSVKAQVSIAYDDLSWNQRLKDFKKVLDLLDELLVRFLVTLQEVKVEVFEVDKDGFKSQRLRRLCTFRALEDFKPGEEQGEADEKSQRENQRKMLESEDGLFDNFTPILQQFKENIDWRKVESDKYMPWPKPGLDEEID